MQIISKISVLFIVTMVLTMFQFLSSDAQAYSSLYTNNCASCHSAPVATTCNGCHHHGPKNLKGTTNKTTYAPGETVAVTVTGGNQSGWIRAIIYNQNNQQVAISSGNASGFGKSTTYPTVLSASAPTTPGTYTWKAAWFGNSYDNGNTNANSHGEVAVSTNSFTVVAPADTTVPIVGTFTLPATASNLTVPITALVASDNVAVTGYLVTTSATAPAANAAGWSATATTSVTAASAGNITFYAWAKDAANNVSTAKSAAVLIDTTSYYFPAPIATLLMATFNGEVLVDSNIMGQTRQAIAGDEIAVFDAAGVLCGRTQITVDGAFGPLVVYGDDPATTGVDEGATNGELLTVRLWDSQRQMELPVRSLQLNGSRQALVWSGGGGATVTLQGLTQSHVGVLRPLADGGVRWYADADGNGIWGGLDFFLNGFGISTDKVAAGDWNGDGILDPGAFRAKGNQGWWYFDTNGSGAWESGIDQSLQFGYATDTPAVGDWNGDGQSDFGVFRAINGLGWWYFDSDGNRAWDSTIDQKLQFGLATDIPVVGDWNGDGQSEFGVFRVINGLGWWYFDSNGNRQWDSGIDESVQFGIEGDVPVVGDWNGDGVSDFGVMRNGVWYLDGNGNRAWDSGTDPIYPSFGLPGDQPMGGVWR